MMGGCFPLVLFFVILIQCQFYAFPLPSTSSSQTNLSSILLQDVLTAITLSERWNLKDVRVSKLDLGKFRFSTSQNYDFHIGIGNQKLTLQTLEEFGFWRKFKKPKSDFPSVFHQLPSLALLHTLHLEGPLDLRVDALHQLSLSLPMNITYTGLKHVLVGEGIILEIRSAAQEASFFHSSHLDLPMKPSSTTFSEWKSELWPFLQSTCMMTVIPINISGAASLAASYSARKPGLHIETTFISEDTILLLPERSDRMYTKTKMSSCSFDAEFEIKNDGKNIEEPSCRT